MWIHRYIEMYPHFSQGLVLSHFFKMWKRRYIEMFPHIFAYTLSRLSAHVVNRLLRENRITIPKFLSGKNFSKM